MEGNKTNQNNKTPNPKGRGIFSGGVGGVTRFLSKKSNVGERTHVRDADSGK